MQGMDPAGGFSPWHWAQEQRLADEENERMERREGNGVIR